MDKTPIHRSIDAINDMIDSLAYSQISSTERYDKRIFLYSVVNNLKSLLPTERQFAETCFDAGRHYQSDVISFDMSGIRTITEPDFETHFKKYTNE